MGNPGVLRLVPGHRHVDAHSASLAPLFSDDRELPKGVRNVFEQADLALVYSTDTGGPFSRHLFHLCGERAIIHDPRPVDDSVHMCDHLLEPLHRLNLKLDNHRVPVIAPEAVNRDYAGKWLAEDSRPLALIHPGSGGLAKRWPLQDYLAVANLLLLAGIRVGMILGPVEEDLATAATASEMLLLRPPDLGALAGVLAAADLYIGNDSGPTHMAAALGLPTVALFGPTDPVVWGPRGARVTLLRAASGNMADLSVQEVHETASQTLGR